MVWSYFFFKQGRSPILGGGSLAFKNLKSKRLGIFDEEKVSPLSGLTLPAVHDFSSTEEEEYPGVVPVELVTRVVGEIDVVTAASSNDANTTVDISSD
jgi:hypothetical protein